MKNIKPHFISLFLVIISLVVILGISRVFYQRFDLTYDKRYTLSPTTLQVLSKIKEPLVIKVLLKGNIPAEYKRLQIETLQLLEEYKAKNQYIRFEFINPLEGKKPEDEIQKLSYEGLTPLMITSMTEGKTSEEYLFPWAIITKGEKQEKVSLLRNKLGATNQEKIQFSVQNLEYAFSDALYKLLLEKDKKIAVLKSNGTLADIQIADFLRSEQAYYHIAPFTLDSVATSPERTLKQLSEFQLCIIAKPTERFTDKQKQVLDQYIMNGGRVLWLLDPVAVSLEDMFHQQGHTMAMPLDLNLGDMLFKYGVRLNYDLLNDWYFTQIMVAQGSGSQTQYTPIPWVYSPMILSSNNHLINKNLDGIRLQFVSSIDTLSNGIKKQILLTSSPISKQEGTPREIILEFPEKTMEGYEKGNFPVAVLLEGTFSSVYKNRVKPISQIKDKDLSTPTKMIVISDGDIIRNDIVQGEPIELGYDKWTNQFFDNKIFLQNCVNYLLDDTSFLQLRNKKVSLAFLDKKKLEKESNYWKSISLIIPLTFLLFIGLISKFWYKKRFS
ncbi:gliding motility-associated ABC transporter substrate-binding protein GldG [Capnocytophaga sp. oral taxon 338]|uniref:gliding motility-associated ABC transporter substrate-binding protein GldG n=1 Tax=Capnocytophaga sp. oral taxon 338 TaxID=710239 RepID=UPI000202F4C9|nr:gliding motility-associated ABC transporter substrate-binding protein GldG [Capnocytophaga sp. oral taxon 338]EGD34299.1 gliding-associated ABC superfamily ATP binding cassette transporter substrate-binding protein GldG [Capnocytophaga sp. oral taxon 338 str. F0234]